MTTSQRPFFLAMLFASFSAGAIHAQVHDFTDQYKTAVQSVVKIHASPGTASGFAVRLRGNSIGDNHNVVITTDLRVVGDDARVDITPHGKTAITGVVIKRCPAPLNLAFIDARLSGIPPLEWAAAEPEIGAPVFIIGTPDIGGAVASGTLTSGVLSNYVAMDTALLQTDATITTGTFGGPLLNLRAEVIGMAQNPTGRPGVNFGLPKSRIEPLVPNWQDLLTRDMERNRRLLGPANNTAKK